MVVNAVVNLVEKAGGSELLEEVDADRSQRGAEDEPDHRPTTTSMIIAPIECGIRFVSSQPTAGSRATAKNTASTSGVTSSPRAPNVYTRIATATARPMNPYMYRDRRANQPGTCRWSPVVGN